ncbi:MAG: bifunctional UDP-N-acetylglucosamine diphosphorylase/glucosamine-1-phosphate N-acetyltransferase GlmU [Alphaproteobacteria bacterium]
MATRQLAAVILAAGQGTRMKSRWPKVLHRLAGRSLIGHVLASVDALAPARAVVVIGKDMDDVAAAVAPRPTAVQNPPLGTGHAVQAAMPGLDGFEGDVLVVFGDTPLLSPETLGRMVAARRAPASPAVVVLGFAPADAGAYGRLVLAADGALERIVEFREASEDERAIRLCNSGVMVIDGARLSGLLGRIRDDNAKGEYYLTDIVALARADGLACAVVTADDPDEVLGINSRAELAEAEAILQRRLRARAMAGGATLTAPETVFFSHDTRLGQDVTVGPHVVFGPGVTVGDDVEIRGFCHFQEAEIADGAVVGPYARLRPGARIGEGAQIGNFVEVKNAVFEAGAKAGHLAYIGDARVGAGANIGAGTITCNYDGFLKSHTDIGVGAFIGSNTSLVAPVRVGDGALIAAGSVIGADVPADALAITRAEQKNLDGAAARYRRRKQAEKAAKTTKTKKD